MEQFEILRHVDHTLLAPTASWEEMQVLCDEAVRYQTASVCIPPSYIQRVHEKYGDTLTICTVIGFPLGYQTTAVKVAETREAIANGAQEVDMVINQGDVKNGDYNKVFMEISAIREVSQGKILKVIIETCNLTEQEKIELCKIVTRAKADFIKTSTGFGSHGATIEDIQLFRANIGPDVKMKAAGGVRTEADMRTYLENGCERIGTSSAIRILQGDDVKGY